MEQYSKTTDFGDTVLIQLQPSQTTTTHNPNHPPTVIFFAWFAAKPRHLAKYAAIFSAMGYNTVQTIGPFSAIYAPNPFRQACYVHSILRILTADPRLTQGGLVCVFMSTAGALCSTQLTTMFAGEHQPLTTGHNGQVVDRIKAAMAAVIFESAPCYIHNSVAANAVIEGLGIPDGVLSWLTSRFFDLFLWFQRRFLWDVPTLFWKNLKKAHYHCPEQYIYSTDDHFMDAERLEALIEERRARGKEIHVLRVADADHILILQKHRKLYIQTVRQVNEWGVNPYRHRVGLGNWVTMEEKSSL